MFIQNKCLKLNGGAISIQNSVNIAQVHIYKCSFILNSASFSTGGAINLSYSNLIIENSNITSNNALIGGGIYYEQVIPDFVLEKSNNTANNKNKIINNNAKIFGHNIGSTIRKLDIDLQNIKIPNGSIKILGERQIEIREFKSGNQITFEGIQLLDEENSPILTSNININEFQFYSSDVQSFIQSLSVSLNWDQSNKKIQVIGQVQSRQYINNGINLQSQIMYTPQSKMNLQIVLDSLPKLIDSQGNIFFNQDQFQKNFTINFASCSIGEITMQQIESIICQECPEGKYSLDQYSTSCKQCPDSAKQCYGSTINLMNGYWRENDKTDIIIYCNKNPQFCQAESPDSKVIFFLQKQGIQS
ncbi:transmembrane protein (macronuclear) [Tetrahymena thermophila SB210]|uniref:Transmembrane protein n=1 Tax=Tetrahymena thermophila (strain SB210) TaxID=312017 RepID=W7X508_TETTS|nr:transmembrane protein [Tetrahymena thermophila SB210]EWS74435.1 transmembrane protein [Tetrahymena thermophila SB210]|eukprot:XP_012653012.1 transmembrane protein [Tetrahymena thermophila SB210]